MDNDLCFWHLLPPSFGFALSVLWIPRRQSAEVAETAARASLLNTPSNQVSIEGRVRMATVALQIPNKREGKGKVSNLLLQ
jgi:hypothetical protein